MGCGHCFEQEVPVLGGRFRFDFIVKGTRLAIELDSDAWHGSRYAQCKDSERDRRTAAVGWTTLRFKSKEVFEDARTCVWVALRTAKGVWEASLENECLRRIREMEQELGPESRKWYEKYRGNCSYLQREPSDWAKLEKELEDLIKFGVQAPPWM
jgi:hypothetical protein